MNPKLRLFIIPLVESANLIFRTTVFARYAIFVLLVHLCLTGSAQYQSAVPNANSKEWEGTVVEPNYRSFPSTETVSRETWERINPGKPYTAGAARYKIFEKDGVKYTEVVEKRNAYENYYVNTANPSLFSLVKGLYPVNFKRNGEWVPIDATLKPMGNNIYEAPDQWNAVGIHVNDHKTYIQTNNGRVQFNDWTLYGVNGNDKTVLAKASWSNYTIGADGIRIINIFPGMDAEMRVSRGGVKTSFVIHEYKFAQYQELYFEDAFKGLRGKGLYFEDNDNDAHKAEAVYADVADETAAIKIAPAFGYAKKNPSFITNFPYHISGNKLSIAVPADYIINNLASGDVIIDPLIQSSNSLAQSLVGFMYNASCNYTNSCDYTISVTPPAAATITDVKTRVDAIATAPCGLNNFAFRISSGACNSPTYYTSITGPGTFIAGFFSIGLLGCMPAPSCTPAPVDFNFKLFRGCVGPVGCDNTCIGLVNPLAIQIEGRTAELDPIAASPNPACVGQNITFNSFAKNGVAPYSPVNWSYNASGTPSLGTGNSITTGAALAPGPYTMYANATDACGTVATTSLAFTVNPLPVVTMGSTGTTICNGATTNITPTSSVPGTTCSWTVVQTGVTGASAGTGTSIAQMLVNTGTTPGTVVYTITPTANGCPGAPITYTVTVNPVNNVLYVDDVNGNDANCGDAWTNALKTLSLALKIARKSNNVQSILVAKGTYYATGDQNATNRDSSFVILRGKLKLYGGYPNGGGTRDITANPTVLSGDIGVPNVNTDNSRHVMVIVDIPSGADSLVIDGFTFTKGYAEASGLVQYGTQWLYQGHGAGMYIQDCFSGYNLALRNLTFSDGFVAILGGGLQLVRVSPSIENCIFKNNRTNTFGGGLSNDHSASPHVTGCSFIGNSSNYAGGAMFTQDLSNPMFTDCHFTGNTASYGGALYNRDGANFSMSKCIFTANRAGLGGAVYNDDHSLVSFRYSVFDSNIGDEGGALMNSATGNLINLNNCVLVNNKAGGASGNGGGAVSVYGGTVNCNSVTLSGNTTTSTVTQISHGIMVMPGATLNFNNSIAWGNTMRQIQGTFSFSYSLIKGTASPLPNLNLDPQFVNAANPVGADGVWFTADDGLQLTNCSPAANMGSNALVPFSLTTDMVGNARIFGTTVDMGAYELQAPVTPIAFTDVVKTYGDADAVVPNFTNCTGLPTTFTITDNTIASMVGNNLHVIKAGTTTITAHTINGTPDVTVSLTVNPKPVTISFTTTPVTKVYDGNTNATISAANLQLAAGDVVGTDDVGIAVSSGTASYDTKDVGTGKTVTIPLANISLTGTSAANYTIANAANISGPVGDITPAAVTITVFPRTKVYGNADPTFNYTISPSPLDAVTGAVSRIPGEDVGTYAITLGTLSLGSNYTITFVGSDLTITRRTIGVLIDAKTKVYGDADPVLTFTPTSSLVGSDVFTGSLERAPGENVGDYTILTGTLAVSSNYDLIITGARLTITPKAITVTADAKTKVFGDADPALTYSFTPALVGTDAFTGSLVRTPGENVGPYAINQGSLALSSNYTITYISNDLNITGKLITVTANPATKTYGNADPALTYTWSPALNPGDVFSGSLTRAAGENVGTFPINQGTLSASGNYTISFVGNNLSITPRAMTVTADVKNKTYGDADPVLTYTYTPALVGADVFTGSLVRTAGENKGAYAISQGTLALSSNYTITFNSNNLNITAKAITITADAKTKLYGDADPALTYTYTPALVGTDVFTGALIRIAGENVGLHAINQGTLALSSNYTITYNSNNLSITPKAITVTAAAKTKIYGDADPALTYTYAPALIGTDVFTGALVRTAGENVGVHAINRGTLALSSNYTITYNGNSLSITPKTITVTAAAKTKIYGDADPALTYSFTPALVGTDAFTGSLVRTAGENVGPYTINRGSLALSSNYTLTYNSNNLNITPKTITVTAAAKTKIYGDADPALTYTWSPALIRTDVFSGALSRTPGENAGSYAINQNSLALNSNYQLVYIPANLVINKAVLTVTAADNTICLNGVINPIPVTYAGFKNGDDASSLTSAPRVTLPRYNKAGNYNLVPSGGVSANYSFNYVNGQLTILPIPEGAITQSPIGPGSVSTPGIASGVQLTAPTGTGYTYAWNTGETTAGIIVKSTATYDVLVTNPLGCAVRFATRVTQQTLVIPNIFSPNGDGIHDRWVIENLQNYPGNVVQLYNRYGQAVFKWTNFTSWDGKVNGKDMPVGTYYYIIDPKNGQKPVTGYIDIIR